MAITAEVAEFLLQRLEKAPGVSKLLAHEQDGDWSVAGEMFKGAFFIHLWSDDDGFLQGAQGFGARKGGEFLHLGFWRCQGGYDGTLTETTNAMWEAFVEQDIENQELGRFAWMPCRKLPHVPELTLFQPPPDPEEDIEGLVTDLFGV